MSICGVGACILGYCDPEVDRAVKKAIELGSMTTLNCPEEVELAELLCYLHPWADMVRYARGGGEAMTVAIRIARAYTGRDIIAFCGYHGWHDWYLAANLGDERSLDGHLLPGLEPAGVPKALKGSVMPFEYNNRESLNSIVNEFGKSIAAIVMEPVRHCEPQKGFLQYVRRISKKTGAVLIFDEVTSGWRMTTGGIHLLCNVNPDIAVFAKAISNGYPMAAIIGRKEVMLAAQKSFISSTYWTERIGPTAAFATIKKHKRCGVAEHLIKAGDVVRKGWRTLAAKHGLKIKIHGISPLSVFQLDYRDKSQAMQTLFTQEMLKRGFLASKAFYPTYSHQDRHLKAYLSVVDEVFNILKEAYNNGRVSKLLLGPIAHTGFKRLV